MIRPCESHSKPAPPFTVTILKSMFMKRKSRISLQEDVFKYRMLTAKEVFFKDPNPKPKIKVILSH